MMGYILYHTRNIKEVKRYRELVHEARQTRKFAKDYRFEDWFEMLGWYINKVRTSTKSKLTQL